MPTNTPLVLLASHKVDWEGFLVVDLALGRVQFILTRTRGLRMGLHLLWHIDIPRSTQILLTH